MIRLRFEQGQGKGQGQGQDQLYWEGVALYGVSAPEQSAVRKLPSELEAACLYVLPGPALGYGVVELLQRLPDTSRVLLLEVEPELAAFCQQHLKGLLCDERVYFQGPCSQRGGEVGPLIEGLHALLERGEAEWWHFRRVRVLALNRLYALQRGVYEQVLRWLEHYVQNFWQNRLTLERLGPLWLRNFFCNLGQLPYCKPFGLRAAKLVLAAAGPSLAWHYDWLRAEREHFTLLAVDTALLPLLKAGIIPDYVMNLDAQVLNLYDFYGAASFLPLDKGSGDKGHGDKSSGWCGPTLLADLTADPRSFSMLPKSCEAGSGEQGSFQITATRFADSRLWARFQGLLGEMGLGGHVPELEPLGSVGVSSLAVALQEAKNGAVKDGFGQAGQPLEFLLLVGYDFAYPKDLHHVRGTSIHEGLLQVCSRTKPCNSFAASLKRPLLDCPEPGFVTDRVLCAYAEQLQDYLKLHLHGLAGGLCCARLKGPKQSVGQLLELSEAEASAQLRRIGSALKQKSGQKGVMPRNKGDKRDRGLQKELVRGFWFRELEILQDLESAVVSGACTGAMKRGGFWPQSDFAADYLLKLCLPKAGNREWQACDWARILYLSRSFSEHLMALLEASRE